MKNKYKLGYSVALNMFILILFLCFTQLRYEIEDNQQYSIFIANGEYHIYFVNYFFCMVVGAIQELIYPLNAFSLSMVFLGYCSFVLITRVMLDKFNLVITTCIVLFLNGFFAVNHYQTVSFTLTPAILCAAGYLGIVHFSMLRKHILGMSISGLLVFIGSLIRFKIFGASTVVAVFWVIGWAVVECYKSEQTKKRLNIFLNSIFQKKRMIVVLIVMIACFASEYVHLSINMSTGDLAYYARYTIARSTVWDYPIPDYKECPNDYDAIDIDENDILLLRKGYMDDEGAFSLEKLSAIANIQTQYNRRNSKSLSSIIKTMIVSELGNMRGIGDKGIACFAVAIIIILFLLIMKKRNYFIPFFLMLITFILYLYLWTTLKVPFRAVYEIWICSAVFLFYSFSWEELKDIVKNIYNFRKRTCLGIIIILSVGISAAGFYLSRLANYTIVTYSNVDTTAELRKYIVEHSEEKFEFSRSCGLVDVINNVYYVSKSDYLKNYQGFSCTYYRHPDYMREIEAFGTDNMYSNLLKDSVYFVDSDRAPVVENMRIYLEKYYAKGHAVTYFLMSKKSDCLIYKFEMREK